MKHNCTVENAPRLADWIQNRGGVAVWRSVNLSNPGASWSTPLLTEDGKPCSKPTWQAGAEPEQVITDPSDIEVTVDREVKRFRVGIRPGSQGLSLKVTDGGSRRIRAAIEKAGEGAYHNFDYDTQEAIIMAPEPESTMSLRDWIEEN